MTISKLFCLIPFVFLGACGGGGGDDDPGNGAPPPPPSSPAPSPPAPPPPPPAATVGTAGGTVIGPNGTQVVVPANALTQSIVINIAQSSSGAPPLPAGVVAVGQTYELTPHGTTFAVPATITVPFDAALVPAGAALRLLKTNAAQSAWEEVPGATMSGGTLSAQITSFSFVAPVSSTPTTLIEEPRREWQFLTLPGNTLHGRSELDGLVVMPGPENSGTQHAGNLLRQTTFGPSGAVNPTTIEIGTLNTFQVTEAPGTVASSPSGANFFVMAESPAGRVGTADAIGSSTRLKQFQSFRKNAENATFSFTVTRVMLMALDLNPRVGRNDSYVKGETVLSVAAYKSPTEYFYQAAGKASVVGERGLWFPDAYTESFSRNTLWNDETFEVERDEAVEVTGPGVECRQGSGIFVYLPERLPFQVDLSAVDVGEEFTVRADAYANTVNRKGAPSAIRDCQYSTAWAFLRDPQEIDGVTIEYTGLTPTNNPLLPSPPEQPLLPPAACPAPNPEAGTLQFAAASFGISEAPGAPQSVAITRTGGTRGAVTATLSTSDGTAHAGVDYNPIASTVHFEDGEAGERVLTLSIIGNNDIDGTRTFNLALSDPGGCAVIGTQATATVQISDEDGVPPPPTNFSVGGTVTGLAGTGLVIEETRSGGSAVVTQDGPFTFDRRRNNGQAYEARIRSQPVNPFQICSVVSNGTGTVAGANVTDIGVQCVTSPPPPAQLDQSFGLQGKVLSRDLFSGAVATALQSDGKIVVLGNQVMQRFDAGGALDTSFGTAGLVSVLSSGMLESNDVAVQPDGKVVMVGAALDQGRRRMAVMRFNADGSVDTGFGTGGRITVHPPELPANANSPAQRVQLLADGTMLLAIRHGDGFAVARLAANGSLDTTFGGGDGSAVVDLGHRIEITEDLAVQSDGKILLTGRVDEVDNSRVNVGIARLNPDGTLDDTFGGDGTVVHDVSGNGGWDEGADIISLPDGRIVIAVKAQPSGIFVFMLARFAADGTFEGASTTPMGPRSDFANAVADQADGRLILVGQVSGDSIHDFGIVRYQADGSLDSSFGSGGILLLDFFGGDDGARDIVIQPDGRILVAGYARNGTSTGLGLVRLVP